MPDNIQQYGSDVDKLITELQYRLGSVEGKIDNIQGFIQNAQTTATPAGLGIAGKYAKWNSVSALGTANVLQESGSVLTVSGDGVPDGDDTRDWGSMAARFANLWAVKTETDKLVDSGAGFVELQDIPFQPKTTRTTSVGTTSKQFLDVFSEDGHFDKLFDAGAGFIEIQDIDLILKTDIGANLGSASKSFLAAYITTLHTTNFTTLSGSGQISVFNDLALSAAKKLQFEVGTNGVFIRSGTGSPEGVVAADIGSVYLRDNGTAGATFYVKESSPTANTGWVAYGAAGASGANTTLSNLVSPTAINQDLITAGDGLAGGHNLGSNTGPHHWNQLYIVELINTGTGNIDFTSNFRPSAPNSYSIGDATHAVSDVWLSQYPSRIYFKQAGNTPSISAGTGNPNGVITADIASVFLQNDGAPGSQVWFKTSGNGANTTWTNVNPAGTSPPGSDKQVIFNDSGGFGADAAFTYDKAIKTMGVGPSGVIFVDGQFQAKPAGGAAAPEYSYSTDTDTGWFHQAANAIGAATSGVERWRIDANGMLVAPTDNTLDIGQSGLRRPRTVYLGTKLDVAGAAVVAQSSGLTSPYVGTPLIDSNTAHVSPVVIADTIQPDGTGLRNNGSLTAGWANNYSFAYRLLSGGSAVSGQIGWTAGAGAPTGTPTPGSIYSRTGAGIANQSFYFYDAINGWTAVGGGASGSFADQQLSNLTGTTAIPVPLLPTGSGTGQIGSGTHRWGGCNIDSIGCHSISSSAGGNVSIFSNLDFLAGGTRPLFDDSGWVFANETSTGMVRTGAHQFSAYAFGTQALAITDNSNAIFIRVAGGLWPIQAGPAGSGPGGVGRALWVT